jgi:type IV pilus assembly protein PilF
VTVRSIRCPAALVAAALLCGGCVTEQTSGRVQPEEQPEEAAQINVDLGRSYLRKGDLQAAQLKLEKAVELDPDNVAAHSTLGLVYEGLDDPVAAEKEYRRAVAIEPDNPDALNSLAVFLCRQSATRAGALATFDRAIAVPRSKYFSNKAMLNTNAGHCANKVGDLVRAENYLRTALTYDGRFPPALFELADVAYQRGNFLQARAFLQRFNAVAAASAEYLWLTYQVETAMGDAAAADDAARALRKDFPASVQTRRLLESQRNAG